MASYKFSKYIRNWFGKVEKELTGLIFIEDNFGRDGMEHRVGC